jgi:hypothetical protein
LLRDPRVENSDPVIKHPHANGCAGARRNRPAPSFRASAN